MKEFSQYVYGSQNGEANYGLFILTRFKTYEDTLGKRIESIESVTSWRGDVSGGSYTQKGYTTKRISDKQFQINGRGESRLVSDSIGVTKQVTFTCNVYANQGSYV